MHLATQVLLMQFLPP
ncbi:hypothetical protein LINPERPRIM_LOCUS9582 [Linum perenne]